MYCFELIEHCDYYDIELNDNYCKVCKICYLDYKKHIKTKKHKNNLRLIR
jgi:hypothetical protein